MSDQPARLPLPEFICRQQHAYEWSPRTGTHSGKGMPRKNPCAECNASAALVVEWLAGEVAGSADEAGAA